MVKAMPEPNKWEIVSMKKLNMKNSEVIRECSKKGFDVSSGEVSKIYKLYKETGRVCTNKVRSGRPRKLSKADSRYLCQQSKRNRFMTAKDLAHVPLFQSRNISPRTISRELNKNGLKARALISKPKISEKNMRVRLKFCKAHKSWSDEEWENIAFSDESTLFSEKTGKVYIRRTIKEKNMPLFAPKETHHGGKEVLVWGYITSNGVGPLVRVEGRLDGEYYFRLIKENLTLAGFRDGSIIWQQDGAGPHRYAPLHQWFHKNGIQTIEWPAQSPDLNLIENVWAYIRKELFKVNKNIRTKQDLWKETLRIWHMIPDDYIRRLYRSLRKRMKEVIDNKGAPICH